MSVKVRLQRFGAKKHPIYRVVVAESRSPRDGKFLELLGSYDPNRAPIVFDIDMDSYTRWVGQGAQPSDTVRTLVNRMNRGELQTSAQLHERQKAALAEARKSALENAKTVTPPSAG